MLDSFKARIERALTKLGLHYQDVSDPEDVAVPAAYFAETTSDRGDRIALLVTLSREKYDVWVQGGLDLLGLADQPDDWLNEAVADFDADLQHAPPKLFSRFKLPSFRARGFRAEVTWSVAQRRIVATVVIPSREFSSAVLDNSIRLVVHLGTTALTTMLAVRQKESQSGGG